MGQVFAIQENADLLVAVEQMPVDKESLLNTQLEPISDEISQESTAALTDVMLEAEIEKNDIAQEEQEVAEVTEEVTEPVVIDRGSILKGCKKSLFNAPLGLVATCAGLASTMVFGRLLKFVDLHGTYIANAGIVLFMSSALLPHVVAPLWTVPTACKKGKYREVIGSLLATPVLATGTFYTLIATLGYAFDHRWI